MKRSVVRALVAGVTLWALVVPAAQPASGHQVTGRWGTGAYDVLGQSYVNRGNVVGMWQAFLYSYDQISCGTFDGIFGPRTARGTRNLQNFWGLTADGIVGRNTWTTAGRWMEIYYNDGYLATYWRPVFARKSMISGLGRFRYIYGGTWSWRTPAEAPYPHTVPEGTWFTSQHPYIGFRMRC